MRSAIRLAAASFILLGPCGSGAAVLGTSLADYIHSLSTAGFAVIYSDDLVRADLLVTVEPETESPEQALRAVLRPHGMLLVPGPGGNWLVVADPEAAAIAKAMQATALTSGDKELLPEIIVNSSMYSIRYQQPGSHTFLDRDYAEELPDIGEEVLRATDRLPGVASGGVSTRNHVRGGDNNETLILLDGLRLYEPFHLKDFHAIATTVNQSVIDGIDYYTAGYQAHYGDRMSGVVDMSLREPPDGRETELGISLFNTSALSSGRFLADDRADWLVAGRRSNLSNVNRAMKRDYGEPEFSDALAHLGWQWTERAYVAANFLYSQDRISIAQADDTEAANANYRNNVVWLKLAFDWSDRTSVTTILSATDIGNSRDGNVDVADTVAGNVKDSRNFSTYGLQQDWLINASDTWTFRAGWNASFLHAAYNYASALTIYSPFDQLFDNQPFTARDFRVRPSGEQYAAFAEMRWKANDKLFFDFGVRVDKQTYNIADSDEQESPRLNVLYKLGDRTELRAGIGRFFQAQEINEMRIQDGVTEFFKPQHADHLVASLLHSFPKSVDLRVEFYRKNYHDLGPRFENAFNTLVLLPELQIDRMRIDPRGALVRGAEVTFSGGVDEDVRWWVGYTWSEALDRIDGSKRYRSWDQTHALKAGVIAGWRSWNFSVAGNWHTGWPKTELLLTEQMNPDGSISWVADTSEINGLRYDSFQSLDVRASRLFQLPKSELTAFIEISNVLNKVNACCNAYSMQLADDGSARLRAEEEHWLPLLPSFGVVWRF